MFIDTYRYMAGKVLDVAGIGYNVYQFNRNRNWKNAGYLVWDVAAAFLPFVADSYIARGTKFIKGDEKSW